MKWRDDRNRFFLVYYCICSLFFFANNTEFAYLPNFIHKMPCFTSMFIFCETWWMYIYTVIHFVCIFMFISIRMGLQYMPSRKIGLVMVASYFFLFFLSLCILSTIRFGRVCFKFMFIDSLELLFFFYIIILRLGGVVGWKVAFGQCITESERIYQNFFFLVGITCKCDSYRLRIWQSQA